MSGIAEYRKNISDQIRIEILNAERSESISETASTYPKIYQAKVTRAMMGNSMRDAIDLKCVDCVGKEDAPIQIRFCNCNKDCPIWHLRPYQKKRS